VVCDPAERTVFLNTSVEPVPKRSQSCSFPCRKVRTGKLMADTMVAIEAAVRVRVTARRMRELKALAVRSGQIKKAARRILIKLKTRATAGTCKKRALDRAYRSYVRIERGKVGEADDTDIVLWRQRYMRPYKTSIKLK